ncbi:MAG: hypothetical protein IKF52_05810 [Clostridia bacterium]|nr:hypothetical protein [Clostridia bacterium]
MVTSEEGIARYFLERADVILERLEEEFDEPIAFLFPMDPYDYYRTIRVLILINIYGWEKRIYVEFCDKKVAQEIYGHTRCLLVSRISKE